MGEAMSRDPTDPNSIFSPFLNMTTLIGAFDLQKHLLSQVALMMKEIYDKKETDEFSDFDVAHNAKEVCQRMEKMLEMSRRNTKALDAITQQIADIAGMERKGKT